MRVIISPALLPPAALAELKQWLGVTTTADDEQLDGLLRAALDVCADFTGLQPLIVTCEEVLAAAAGWLSLSMRPVVDLVSLAYVAADGTRSALATECYDWVQDADGVGRLRLHDTGAATGVAARFTAGLAVNWDALPDVLRHGVIRLAAHQYRTRESVEAAPVPPVSVAALWRPWRRLRLA